MAKNKKVIHYTRNRPGEEDFGEAVCGAPVKALVPRTKHRSWMVCRDCADISLDELRAVRESEDAAIAAMVAMTNIVLSDLRRKHHSYLGGVQDGEVLATAIESIMKPFAEKGLVGSSPLPHVD